MGSYRLSERWRYPLTVLVFVGAVLFRTLLFELTGYPGPLLLYSFAVMVIAWRAGVVAGLLATVLYSVTEELVLRHGYIARPAWLYIGLFLVVGVGTSFLVGRIQKARRMAEETLRRQEEVISMISHDLRTPLTSILMITQCLSRDTPNDHKLKILQRGANRMSRLVNDLLEYSYLRSEKVSLYPQECDVCEITHQVLDECCQEFGQQIKASVSCNPSKVLGTWDSMRLEQVLANLIGNAYKYGLGRPIEVCVEGQKDSVRILVQDQGLGISKEDQEVLFLKFSRSKDVSKVVKGYGLGLWIANELVKAMGGSIGIESALGFGTKFIVDVPKQPCVKLEQHSGVRAVNL